MENVQETQENHLGMFQIPNTKNCSICTTMSYTVAALHSGNWCPVVAFLTTSTLEFSLMIKICEWEKKKLLFWGANTEI